MTSPDAMAALLERLDRLEAVTSRGDEQIARHEALLKAAEGSPLLSRKAADQLYSPAVMRRELGAGGSAPLPISDLPGQAAQIQSAAIPELTQLPEIGDPTVQQNSVVVVAGTLYRRAAKAWQALSGGGQLAPAPDVVPPAGGGSASAAPGGNPVVAVIQDASPTLAGLPALPAKGDLYRNTYFWRVWQWDGTAWHYYEGQIGAGACVATSGAAPSGGLWHTCDGTSVSCALDNATIGSITAPDTRAVGADSPMIMGGAGAAQLVAARQKWETTARTETQALSVGGSSISTTNATVQVGVGASVIASVTYNDTESVSPNPHSHQLKDANAQLKVPSEANGGLPLRVSLAWWMRQ